MSCRIDESFIQDVLAKMRTAEFQAQQYEQIRRQLEECLQLFKLCKVDSEAKRLVDILIRITEEGKRHHMHLAQLFQQLTQSPHEKST
jgi:hypothetical protein